MKNPSVLVCDPSFTAWGWAVVYVGNISDGIQVLDYGCIKTAPEAKKRRIRQGDDRVRRTSEIIRELQRLEDKYRFSFVIGELPHGSQNAKAAIMMGTVVGVLQTFAMLVGVPIEWYSENDAKKAVLGRNSASKADIISEVENRVNIKISGPKYAREAVADSLAIYIAAQQSSPTLQILRNR